MNSIIKVKAFTLLELLVVLAVLGVFSAIAYPNISNWITDREVRAEAYEFVAEINQIKSKVMSGEYALGMVHFSTPNFQKATLKKYYMSTEDYIQNYSGSRSNWPHCDYDTRNQRYKSEGTLISDYIRHWPNIHLCISKNGSKKGILNDKNPEAGQSRSLGRVVFCSINNSSTSGSTRCNINNKIKSRYLVTWDQYTNLKVYKFNFKKNQWCNEKKCRSNNEFN